MEVARRRRWPGLGQGELGECGLEVERSVVMTATVVQAPLRPNNDAVCRMLTSDADWAAAVDLHAVEHHTFDPAEFRDFGIRDLVMLADPDYPAIRIYRSLEFADCEIQIQLSSPNN